MRRTSKPIALFLLSMAVLCTPAGVCVIDGVAATTVQAAAPAHAHACCKNVEGTVLTANDDSCCSESRGAFVAVLRFMLEKQAAPFAFEFEVTPVWPTHHASFRIADRRPPFVLRI
jgi:hypothetical protein